MKLLKDIYVASIIVDIQITFRVLTIGKTNGKCQLNIPEKLIRKMIANGLHQINEEQKKEVFRVRRFLF